VAAAATVLVAALGTVWAPGVAVAAPTTTTVSYTGPPVAIPDGADLSGTSPGAEVGATLPVAGLAGSITDVNLRIDGTACTNAIGATTVGLDHTFVNDLQISITAPDNTKVLVINQTDGSGNNFCQTVLDDEAPGAVSIQSVVSANAPFTGTFTPNAPLSAFDGGNPNGNWTLSAQDFFSADTGSIRAFSLIITTDTADVSATKTVAGTFAEGGTVTYTITSTNSGGVAAADNPGNELDDVLPTSLTLVSAVASSGTAVANLGTNTVTWNGAIPAASSVTVTITATVNAGTEGQTISNQASVAWDADGNGTNEATALSDDPSVAGTADPTSFDVTVIPPSVTIEQAAGQADPTTVSPVHFTVTFSEPVTGFIAADVTLSGTAGATTATVTGSGATYDVAVTGMTTSGTVIATVPAGSAADAAGGQSLASTSADNSVTFDASTDLAIDVSHTGTFAVGDNGTLSIVVTNASANEAIGTTTVSQTLPDALTFVSAAGTGWTCTSGQTFTCTRSDSLAAGASFPAITVTVTPTAAAAPSVTVSATVANAHDTNAANTVDSDVIGVAAVLQSADALPRTGAPLRETAVIGVLLALLGALLVGTRRLVLAPAGRHFRPFRR
jgi:fimbrial isopeptide formation D2 family protein/uncharacterized repeat protein (TIGR01451 family)